MKKQTENTTQNVSPTGGAMAEPSASAGGEDFTGEGANSRGTPAYAGGFDPAADGNSQSITLADLQTENEMLRATIRQTTAHRQITGELAKAGARSPELLFASVRSDVQFGEDGSVVNAAALVQRLRASFPEQFGFARPSGSIDGGAGLAAAPRLTKEALAKMKPAEIAALDWADVRRVLAQ
ncbi:hypothetical protein BH10ACI2_BH10ACI2_16270 [soil metagenome]